jgi:hypothetical protein
LHAQSLVYQYDHARSKTCASLRRVCVYLSLPVGGTFAGAEWHFRRGSCFAMRRTLHQGLIPYQGTILEDCGACMKVIAMHDCHRECGDAVQDQVMTMRTKSKHRRDRNLPTHRTLAMKHKLQARLINHTVLLSASLWRFGVGVADGGGRRGLGGSCTPDAADFQLLNQVRKSSLAAR